jgi:hypothetical protein
MKIRQSIRESLLSIGKRFIEIVNCYCDFVSSYFQVILFTVVRYFKLPCALLFSLFLCYNITTVMIIFAVIYIVPFNAWCYLQINTGFFYAVKTVHFGMKLYNGPRNAQVFNLFMYLLLPYVFRAFF